MVENSHFAVAYCIKTSPPAAAKKHNLGKTKKMHHNGGCVVFDCFLFVFSPFQLFESTLVRLLLQDFHYRVFCIVLPGGLLFFVIFQLCCCFCCCCCCFLCWPCFSNDLFLFNMTDDDNERSVKVCKEILELRQASTAW